MKNIVKDKSAERVGGTLILLAVLLMITAPGTAHAGVGDVIWTAEINDSTTNSPVLADEDYFGYSVANIGDLDNDGVDDLAVGAPSDDDSGTDRGAVHILFMNANGSIASTVEINDSTTNGPNLADNDHFGWSVANIGDLNSDGVADLAVGAPWDDGSGTDRGALHIMFMNTNGSVASTIEINDTTANAPTLADGDFFGVSVANIGDLDNDGVADLAVGAPWDDDSGTDRGAVHILFMSVDGTIKSNIEINDSTTNGPSLADWNNFGTSVANIGDLNNDGVADLAVGAHSGSYSFGPGALHILFMETDGSMASAAVEINDSTTNGPTLSYGDDFGVSVANIGDLDNDGIDDLAVGALADDGTGTDRGALHILFMYADGSVASVAEINDTTTNGPALADGDFFASSLSNIGDLNNDGVDDLAVCAPYDDDSGTDRGAVHIIYLEGPYSDTTPPVITLTGADPINLEAGVDTYTEQGAIAVDAVDGTFAATVGGATVDVNTVGVYIVTYDATDTTGNAATQETRTVHVVDTRSPVITLTGASIISLVVGVDTYTELGATAVDAVDGLFAATVGGATVDPNIVGVYVVTYDAIDAAGNPATQVTRRVNVTSISGDLKSTVEINDSTANAPVLSDVDSFGSSVANIGSQYNYVYPYWGLARSHHI